MVQQHTENRPMNIGRRIVGILPRDIADTIVDEIYGTIQPDGRQLECGHMLLCDECLEK